MNLINIKGLTIGEGMPKICVPMVSQTSHELIEEAEFLKTIDLDMVEWRVDFFEMAGDLQEVIKVLDKIRAILPNIPLLFTFRSKREGGAQEISREYYITLNEEVCKTGQIDLIDVELFEGEDTVKRVVQTAHAHNVFVIVSNHDFQKTPTKEEIISRLRRAQEWGGDLPKIAVMPNGPRDVLTLLDATNNMREAYADRPIITMSMAGLGLISRLSGELFGSAVTFAAGKTQSAPGQINVSNLRQALQLLHEN